MTLARIVKLVDNNTLVINKGLQDGVTTSDKFLIYGLDEELIDPDSGESLGALEVVRGRGRVTHLQARLATLSTYETVIYPGQKKVIKRDGRGVYSYLQGGPSVEEVEDGPTTEVVEFKNAQVGDYAKPI